MTASSHLTFQGLSATQAYVLGEDGNLWLESAPWRERATVPRAGR